MRFLFSFKLRRLRSEFISKQLNSNVQKFYFSGIPRPKFSKRKRQKPRKTPSLSARNDDGASQGVVGPLFNEILGILGTANVLSHRSLLGIPNLVPTRQHTRINETMESPSKGSQGACLNAEQRLEQQDEDHTVELVQDNTLVSEGLLKDGIDVSPLVRKITEIVRDESNLQSMQLLKCLAISGNIDAVYAVQNDMIEVSQIREEVVYGIVLKCFCIAGKIKEALELIRTLRDKNVGMGLENFKTLVKGLCRADRVADALEIVDIMKKKNSVDEEVYEVLVNGYLRNNDGSGAFSVLKSLKDSGYQPTLPTYTNLMQYLIRINELQKALDLYDEMLDTGIHLDNVVATSLVASCISQNCISEGWRVFNSMVEKRVRMTQKSYSIFIKELCKVSATDDIVKMLMEMQASKIKVGDDILQLVISYMKKNGEMEKVKKIQQIWMTCNSGYQEKDSLVENNLVPNERNSLVSNGNIEPELHVKWNPEMLERVCSDQHAPGLPLKSYKEDDLHEICRILSASKDWCSIQDDLEKYAACFTTELVADVLRKCSLQSGAVLRFFSWVGKQSGYKHNAESYNMAIKLSGRAKDFKNMRSLFHEMRRNGCPITSDTWTIMILLYGRTGLTDIALRTFKEMKASGCKPNKSTYKFLVISLCGRKGRKADEAVQIFQDMISAACHPDKEMLESFFSCLCEAGKLSDARKAIETLQKIGFTVPLTCSLYVRSLCRARKVEEALKVVEEFGADKRTLDQYTYGSLVHSLLQSGRYEEAMAKVESMKQVGIHPTVHVYTSLIVHFFKQKQVHKALETFETMKEMGCQPTTVTYSAMVRGYAEMGKSKDAWDVFYHMRKNGPHPDFKTYSMFIDCLCKTGSSEEALQLLGDMLNCGIVPSTVNFQTVMYGLNREGKYDLAKTVLRTKTDLKFQRRLTS
ncbi:OLC1v1034012C1 [Oldenlandia corymbosa var. corymbosa]|uniref:OLC1v1034012C1 n=1 Tax=Oldenlandia corymbosa var. corymbosa TaxID=529605 RepID=A0AAV1CS66_OLDCO|nr:OLC1v1034012C1 [Oldenlandia corymbosa var. corymbosa]